MSQTETTIDVREVIDIKELVMAQLLTDDYCLKIISGTAKKGMSVKEMAFTYFIPFATCYKKVAQLEAIGLLREDGKALKGNGKKYSVYSSCLKNLEVNYKNKRIVLEIELEGQGPKKITLDLTEGSLLTTT
ncbi:MAG: hypothetical protein QF682_02375 [Candidatus Thermoplasmatota archaeon]|jgi:predicted transcriptional regulator|nr:hypothetical protein [Candidatus Thermoplasmatota archaeon]